MQRCPRAQRSLGFNFGFQAHPLRAEIPPDSLTRLMGLWIADGEIPKFLAIVSRHSLVVKASGLQSVGCGFKPQDQQGTLSKGAPWAQCCSAAPGFTRLMGTNAEGSLHCAAFHM